MLFSTNCSSWTHSDSKVTRGDTTWRCVSLFKNIEIMWERQNVIVCIIMYVCTYKVNIYLMHFVPQHCFKCFVYGKSEEMEEICTTIIPILEWGNWGPAKWNTCPGVIAGTGQSSEEMRLDCRQLDSRGDGFTIIHNRLKSCTTLRKGSVYNYVILIQVGGALRIQWNKNSCTQ